MSKRILVVENDRGVREVIAEILQEEGYLVSTMGLDDGLLEHILDFNPDAILLDIIKPSDKGSELCEALKASGKTQHIPVIVLSTHLKIAESIKEVCADDVLAKPFDISELVNVLEKQL